MIRECCGTTTTRRRACALVVVALVVAALAGCSKSENTVVHVTDGAHEAAAAVDADPLALFPSGIVALASIDAQALFSSEFGPDLQAVLQRSLPLPPEAGIDVQRDIESVLIGAYTMQGADFVGLLRGTFDAAAVAAAAEAGHPTPVGKPLTKSQYTDRDVYGVNDVGFTVLTERTLLFGNTTALRRVLDRIEEGRVERQLPKWLLQLVEASQAPLSMALDLAGEPLPDAARRQLPFLNGAETIRLLANFEPPGLNVAGTLTYGSAEQAQGGAQALRQGQQLLDRWGWAMALIGLSQPLEKLDVETRENEAQFVAGLKGQALKKLIQRAPSLLGLPQPSDARPQAGATEAGTSLPVAEPSRPTSQLEEGAPR